MLLKSIVYAHHDLYVGTVGTARSRTGYRKAKLPNKTVDNTGIMEL